MTVKNAPPLSKGLPRRALGKTGRVLPILGFGVSGPHAQTLVPRADTAALIKTAISLGVEMFDTAPFYGDGEAESRLGEALAHTGPGAQPFIMTKAGTLKANGKWTKDFSQAGLAAQLDQSASRLPHIDALFLHGFPLEGLSPDSIAWLADMKSEGRFRHLGVAARDKDLDVALDTGLFDLVMSPVNRDLNAHALNRLEDVRSQGLGVVGIECMANAAQKIRFSLRPADLWYSARALFRRNVSSTQDTPEDALAWALNSGLADVLLFTTTRQAHLSANVNTATGLS